MTSDNEIEAKYEETMNQLARAIDVMFNGGAKGDERQTGFVLLTFPFGSNDGRCNYISNGAAREDIVVLFKEMIARFEGQPEMSGAA